MAKTLTERATELFDKYPLEVQYEAFSHLKEHLTKKYNEAAESLQDKQNQLLSIAEKINGK